MSESSRGCGRSGLHVGGGELAPQASPRRIPVAVPRCRSSAIWLLLGRRYERGTGQPTAAGGWREMHATCETNGDRETLTRERGCQDFVSSQNLKSLYFAYSRLARGEAREPRSVSPIGVFGAATTAARTTPARRSRAQRPTPPGPGRPQPARGSWLTNTQRPLPAGGAAPHPPHLRIVADEKGHICHAVELLLDQGQVDGGERKERARSSASSSSPRRATRRRLTSYVGGSKATRS